MCTRHWTFSFVNRVRPSKSLNLYVFAWQCFWYIQIRYWTCSYCNQLISIPHWYLLLSDIGVSTYWPNAVESCAHTIDLETFVVKSSRKPQKKTNKIYFTMDNYYIFVHCFTVQLACYFARDSLIFDTRRWLMTSTWQLSSRLGLVRRPLIARCHWWENDVSVT